MLQLSHSVALLRLQSTACNISPLDSTAPNATKYTVLVTEVEGPQKKRTIGEEERCFPVQTLIILKKKKVLIESREKEIFSFRKYSFALSLCISVVGRILR